MTHTSHNQFHTSYALDNPCVVDPLFGPSSHARFDHEFKTDSLLDSFASLQKNIALQQPGLSQEKAYNLALIQFNTLMVPRQVGSYLAEKRGDEEMSIDETWEIQGDKLFHPQYGDYDEMIVNAKTSEEADSLRQWKETALNASPGTRVVSLDMHVAREGQFEIRYADIAIREPGKIRLEKRIDLALDNQHIGQQEAWERMQSVVATGKITLHSSGTNKVGVLSIEPGLAAAAELVTSKLRSSPVRMMDRVAQNIVKDTKETTSEAWRYLFDKKEPLRPKEEYLINELPVVSQKLRELLINPKQSEALTQLTIQPQKREKDEQSKDVGMIWKKKAQEVLHISREQSEKLLEEVVDTWHMMTSAEAIVSFAADTRIGTGAALYALSLMSMESLLVDGFDQEVEEQAPFPIEVISLSEQEQEVVFSLFIPAGEIPRTQARGVEEKILPVAIDQGTLTKTIEFVQKIDALPVLEQKQMIVEEKKHIIKQILLLWEIIGETARAEGKNKVQSVHSEAPVLNVFKENNSENAPVEKFTFALAAWMLLKLTQYYASLETLEAFVDKKDGLSLAASIQKEKPKDLVQKEGGQWILLSIIWYLAQIREQGFVQQKAVPKKKKKKHAPVVIFAYGS